MVTKLVSDLAVVPPRSRRHDDVRPQRSLLRRMVPDREIQIPSSHSTHQTTAYSWAIYATEVHPIDRTSG